MTAVTASGGGSRSGKTSLRLSIFATFSTTASTAESCRRDAAATKLFFVTNSKRPVCDRRLPRPCSSACFFLGRQQRPWKPFCEESVCSDWHLYWRTTSTKRSVGNRHFYSYAGMGSKSFREQLHSNGPSYSYAGMGGKSFRAAIPLQRHPLFLRRHGWQILPGATPLQRRQLFLRRHGWQILPGVILLQRHPLFLRRHGWQILPGATALQRRQLFLRQEWVANPSGGNSTSTAPVIPTQTWVASTEGPTGGYIPTQTYGAAQTYHPVSYTLPFKPISRYFPANLPLVQFLSKARTLFQSGDTVASIAGNMPTGRCISS